jgi:hypothetical protein
MMRSFRLRAISSLLLLCGCLLLARTSYRSSVRRLMQAPLYDASRFALSTLTGLTITNPTVLRFGPGGALYVATRWGQLHRLELVRRTDAAGYRVGRAESIPLVAALPNHDDTGLPRLDIQGRLITGLAVTGAPGSPIVYVVSSDPRIERDDIDTNSGILSRLTRTASGWQRTDLIRGLPRSRNDHTPNGIVFDPDGRTLYLSIGSATNLGAPSDGFLHMRETPLTASILAVDLQRLGDRTLDLPTLDDPSRPGERDANDPFGGNNGANEAALLPGGPVRIHAEGLRNAYSLLMTPAGIITIDNGANAGFGGPPRGTDPSDLDRAVEGGESLSNPLYLIPRAGLFFGHPNLARPAPRSAPEPPLLHFSSSTNGLGLMPGTGATERFSLVTVSLDRSVTQVTLDRHGRILSRRMLLSEFGGMPLDVTTGAGPAVTPGSIWIADMGESSIHILEPVRGQSLSSSRLLRAPGRILLSRFLLWWLPVRNGILDAEVRLRERWGLR